AHILEFFEPGFHVRLAFPPASAGSVSHPSTGHYASARVGRPAFRPGPYASQGDRRTAPRKIHLGVSATRSGGPPGEGEGEGGGGGGGRGGRPGAGGRGPRPGAPEHRSTGAPEHKSTRAPEPEAPDQTAKPPENESASARERESVTAQGAELRRSLERSRCR